MTNMKTMTVREFINLEIDIDVVDDYDERCYIGFCGPLELTPEGERRYKKVLDMNVDVFDDIASVNAYTAKDADRIRKFFYHAAGYCTEETWNKCFAEGGENDGDQ